MLSRSLMTLAVGLGSAYLWLSALQELAHKPVTHTGTQTYHRAQP